MLIPTHTNLFVLHAQVLDAMRQDAEIEGMPLLRVDGGATKSDLLMQIQVCQNTLACLCLHPFMCVQGRLVWLPWVLQSVAQVLPSRWICLCAGWLAWQLGWYCPPVLAGLLQI